MTQIEIAHGPIIPGSLTDRYQWAVERLRAEFGAENVWGKSFDWGFSFSVAVQIGDRRTAYKLEHSWITNYDAGERYWDDEIEQWRRHPPKGGWTYETFSLNACPDREERVTGLIQQARETLG